MLVSIATSSIVVDSFLSEQISLRPMRQTGRYTWGPGDAWHLCPAMRLVLPITDAPLARWQAEGRSSAHTTARAWGKGSALRKMTVKQCRWRMGTAGGQGEYSPVRLLNRAPTVLNDKVTTTGPPERCLTTRGPKLSLSDTLCSGVSSWGRPAVSLKDNAALLGIIRRPLQK